MSAEAMASRPPELPEGFSLETYNESYDETISGYYEYIFIRDFIRSPGQHLIEIGRPGTGKTQGLYWLIDYLREYSPKETILYFDIGKGEEILTLLHYFGAATIFLLPGCSLDMELFNGVDSHGRPYDIKFKTITSPRYIWSSIERGRLNIASFEPFILDETVYLNEISELFTSLIRMAHRKAIKVPLTIIYDEFHNVAPSSGYGFAEDAKSARIQRKCLNRIKKNVQKLRVEKIRLIVSTHEWFQIFKGVRTAFEWILIRRGSSFAGDVPNLAQFNPRWQRIPDGFCYIGLPDRSHSALMRLPYYLDGAKLGRIAYRGIYGDEEDED